MDKKAEKTVKETYAKLLKVGFGDGPIEEMPQFIAKDVMGYGTALDEKILSIGEFIDLIHDQRKQAKQFEAFKYTSNPVVVRMAENGHSALVVDEIELETVIDGETNVLPLRMSTVMEVKDGVWKITHWHGSLAEHVSEGEDPWHVNEWKKKTAKLEKMVEEKTTDLERKNRELEIETALERVRAVAMSMQKPDDLLDVCEIISDQLEALNVKNIRNVQLAIIDEEKKNYANYQYFTAYSKKVFEEPVYGTNPSADGMVRAMQKSANSFFIGSIQGEELRKFIEWRTRDDQIPDPLLDESDKVYYYFYSIGKGGLGLTTYKEISKESLEIFKRFHNVFTLAYRRFKDLRKALEQAREAEIGLALERVRARTMAMQKSEGLTETTALMARQMKELGEEIDQITIGVFNEEENVIEAFGTVKGNQFLTQKVPINETFVMGKVYKAWKKKKKSIVVKISGEKLIRYNKWRNEFLNKNIYPVDDPDGTWIVNAALFSRGLLSFSSEKAASPETIRLLERFAAVFDLTYTRFLDLQKAEAQAREAQVEAALERVRAKAMAMHNSEDLATVVDAFFSELAGLNITPHRCGMGIIDEDTRIVNIQSTTTNENNVTEKVTAQLTLAGHPVLDQIYKNWKLQKEYHPVLRGREIIDYYNAMNPEVEFPAFDKDEVQYGYYFYFKEGGVYAWTDTELEEKELEVFRKYNSVLSLTLRRYFDLKEAEKQAREARIEAALERVRSRSMGMQKSEELADLSFELVKQVDGLGINTWFCAFNIYDDDPQGSLEWGSNTQGTYEKYRTPREGVFLRYYEAGQKGEKLLINEIGEDECPSHYKYLCSLPGVGEQLLAMKDSGIPFPTSQIDHVAFFKYGYIIFITFDPVPEAHDIFKRFAKVFEQTYTRFLDLQKAEAQAREAQIELALERIRAKVTAMSESAELLDIVVTMRKEFVSLGHEAHYFWYMRYLPKTYEKAMTSGDGTRIGMVMTLPRHIHGDIKLVADWETSDEPTLVFAMDTSTAVDYVHKMITLGDFKQVDPQAPTLDDIRDLGGLTFIMARTQYGEIGFSLPGYVADPPQESLDTLDRFASVFDLAYRRFEDLQTAEKQNRETQIELSLERVRARTMAMQKSEELAEVVSHLFIQLDDLGIATYRCNLAIVNPTDKNCKLWSTTNEGKVIPVGIQIPLTENIHLEKMYTGWKKQNEPLILNIEGADRLEWIDYINRYVSFSEYNAEKIDRDKILKEPAVFHNVFFRQGFFTIHTIHPLSPSELEILQRFAHVFEQTYTRFQDLKRAEEQALEAVKRASLDRVRGQIASMRTPEDLQRITPLIWQELTTLDVPFFRCGVFIVNNDQKEVDVYLTTPDGKPLGALHLPFEANDLTRETVSAWKQKRVYTAHWDKKAFTEWMHSMVKLGQIKKADYQGGAEPPDNLHLHFIPFDQGMLYVGHSQPLEKKQIDLVKSLAETFAIAYARYEDFKHLEEAKSKVEKTLTELKAAQSQLIHAEKMASLGELTAGIAHEIQNPLNFVNNFSDVSVDMLEELVEELDNGHTKEVLDIAEDLRQNLDKIHHHGKRASSIVKGMLEHSRSGSGEKIPTDINSLADEYLRLAYHGLRAKDKSFQADFNLEADPSLPKVNIIGQDIGRVFLNLINNAFYACTERSRQAISENLEKQKNGYKPTVIVRTKYTGREVEIRVRDNGNGIPKKVLDKIFQPFFTTKPTGQGTGLGLSLSYDIITKGHGGQLKVETKEGEGTEFIIHLPTA